MDKTEYQINRLKKVTKLKYFLFSNIPVSVMSNANPEDVDIPWFIVVHHAINTNVSEIAKRLIKFAIS